MAHDILTETIDAMLHVQFLDAGRNLLHLLVMVLLLTRPGSRDVGVHGRRNMKSDCVHAVQGVEYFWPNDSVSRSSVKGRMTELTRRNIGLSAITA